MKIKSALRSWFVGILFLGSCCGLIFYICKSEVFNVSQIEWELSDNNYPYYFKSLQGILDSTAQFAKGQSLWKVPIYDLEQNLEKLSWVESAHVTRHFPDKLVISLELRKIVASVFKSADEIQPIAQDGTLLQPAKITESPLVPVLTSSDFRKDSKLRFEIVGVLNKIPKEGLFSQDTISEIQIGKEKSFLFLLKSSKTKVSLNSDNTEIKVARVNKVLNYLDQNQIKGRVIDANFSKKVLVKPRNTD